MQITASNLLAAAIVLANVVTPALIEPAFAGQIAITPVPGPVAAVGVPALIVFGGAYWLVRKLRARRRLD
jgi:hypothetical protein